MLLYFLYQSLCANHIFYDTENLINGGAVHPVRDNHSKDVISFSKVDIVTPTQKMLARELTCDVELGGSLLVTGWCSCYFTKFSLLEGGFYSN